LQHFGIVLRLQPSRTVIDLPRASTRNAMRTKPSVHGFRQRRSRRRSHARFHSETGSALTIVPAGQFVMLPGAAPDVMSTADRMIQNWRGETVNRAVDRVAGASEFDDLGRLPEVIDEARE
jgi:hypothetical protein